MGAEGTIYAQFAFDENLSGRLRVQQGRALVSTCRLQASPCFSVTQGYLHALRILVWQVGEVKRAAGDTDRWRKTAPLKTDTESQHVEHQRRHCILLRCPS